MSTYTDIRWIVRDELRSPEFREYVRQELERHEFRKRTERFSRTWMAMLAVIWLEVLAIIALILWRGV